MPIVCFFDLHLASKCTVGTQEVNNEENEHTLFETTKQEVSLPIDA